jgi:hypothetical protein
LLAGNYYERSFSISLVNLCQKKLASLGEEREFNGGERKGGILIKYVFGLNEGREEG